MFVSHQELWSPSTSIFAGRVDAFKVETAQYVALPFYNSGTTYDYRCELFLFNESAQLLVSSQNISTFGVEGVSAITSHNGVTFLAVSNNYNQAGSYNVVSYIMRFNGATKLFEHLQNVTTTGAFLPEFFKIASDTYLAIPNFFNGTSYLQGSVIYKLNSLFDTFSTMQTIMTDGGTHIKPWTRNSLLFLSVINYRVGLIDIFAFDSTQARFVQGTALSISSPCAADVIDIAGSVYMAIAPSGTNGRIYKWNDATATFETTQSITVSSDSAWYRAKFLTAQADTFLALGDRLYKFCGGQFVLA
jgi:hypothetical protein